MIYRYAIHISLSNIEVITYSVLVLLVGEDMKKR